MKKKFTTTLIAALFMTGFAFAQGQTATPPETTPPETVSTPPSSSAPIDSCCSAEKASACSLEKPCTKDIVCDKCTAKKSCHEILSKEERHRFCLAKKAAITANPALGGKGHKQELCEAICKQDSGMQAIIDKLKKYWEECKKLKKEATTPAS